MKNMILRWYKAVLVSEEDRPIDSISPDQIKPPTKRQLRYRKAILQMALFICGRFARYRVVGKTYLPANAVLRKPDYFDAETGRKEYHSSIYIVAEKESGKKLYNSNRNQTIQWRKAPNHFMEPLNFGARLIYRAFLNYAGPHIYIEPAPKAPYVAKRDWRVLYEHPTSDRIRLVS